jgi:hypothetical protein
MRMLVTILVLSILAGCRMKEAPAARVDDGRFHPPADGRLSTGPIQSYLDVLEKMKANASADDADVARQLGFDADEYAWVKARIVEASDSEAAAREMRDRTERGTRWNNAGVEFSKAEIQKLHDEATDEQTRRRYAEMLVNYDSEKAAMMKDAAIEESAVAYNRNILSPYRCKPPERLAGVNYNGIDEAPPLPCVVMKTFD